MIDFIKRKYKSHLDEVLKTIKLIEVEERFDLHFSRFYGLFFARIAQKMRLTPTHVSLISLVVGIIGGGLLFFQDQLEIVITGGLLVIWAGVLDSSDGQLARMTGQSSEMGRIIDGLIDNLVFGACYLGGCLYFFDSYGWWIFLLGAAAGYAQSFKAALYEFYKSEFLYLAGRIESGYIPLSIDELKPTGVKWYHKIMHILYVDYTDKQIKYTTRSKDDRSAMQDCSKENKNNFRSNYSKLNTPLLFWWAWLSGSNTHRNALIIFSIFGRFDLFLWISLIWTLGVWPVSLYQKRMDRKLLLDYAN